MNVFKKSQRIDCSPMPSVVVASSGNHAGNRKDRNNEVDFAGGRNVARVYWTWAGHNL
jgi:hypothetical protein